MSCKYDSFVFRMRRMSSADVPRSAAPAAVATPLPATPRAAAPAEPRLWTSAALLDGGREALIEHVGAVYRLRLTSSGKLILTK
jgi:hemin uptake protein HemP